MKKIISRYLSDDSLKAVRGDFEFLITKVKESGHEFDLQIRDDYLNLYYKGNSIGKISYHPRREVYSITVNVQFLSDGQKNRFPRGLNSCNAPFILERNELHPFYSSKNLLIMSQKVKDVGFQEEIVFEQMLMSDNLGREDIVIIDRQVMDRNSSTKMDLLALKLNKAGSYQFCVIEVKLGNNVELCQDVYDQLEGYKQRIEDHFEDYRKSYIKNVQQKQILGLLRNDLRIKIVPGVLGFIVVGGYSGVAERSIQKLKQCYHDAKVMHLKNRFDLNKIEL